MEIHSRYLSLIKDHPRKKQETDENIAWKINKIDKYHRDDMVKILLVEQPQCRKVLNFLVNWATNLYYLQFRTSILQAFCYIRLKTKQKSALSLQAEQL